MNKQSKRVFALAYAFLFLSPALRAEETCPVEVKLLLAPPTIETVIASLGFEKKNGDASVFLRYCCT